MAFTAFHDLLRYLKKSLPLTHKVIVRRMVVPSGNDGDCRFFNNSFYIRINKNLTESVAIDTLLHELGHCLAWNDNPVETIKHMHNCRWGNAYSQVYRKFLEWNQN